MALVLLVSVVVLSPGGSGPRASVGRTAEPRPAAPLVTPGSPEPATESPNVAATAAAPRPVRKASGTVLDERTFRRVINGKMSMFRLCYERQARRSSSLQGRLTVEISIGTSGAVTGASIRQDSLGDASVSRCVRSVARTLRFPPPRAPTRYSFPFVFQAGH